MKGNAFTVLWTSVFFCGCSLWIDDFSVDDDSGEQETDSEDQTESFAPPKCGLILTSPSGERVELCSTKGGVFLMGCNPLNLDESCETDEVPLHSVGLSEFMIQRYETTEAQFASFVKQRPEWGPNGSAATIACKNGYLSQWRNGAPAPGTENTPVLWICWYAADAYCRWLGNGMHLPTEAQWEFAARTGSDGQGSEVYRIYPFGNNPTCALENYSGCRGTPVAVGSSYGVSPMGLSDMGGNVSEWMNDWYRNDYYCDPEGTGKFSGESCNTNRIIKDPSGDSEGFFRSVRGGSWYHNASMMRTAKRTSASPDTVRNLIGFRCAY